MEQKENNNKNWLIVAGTEEPNLANSLQERVQDHIAAKHYTANDIKYISMLKLALCSGDLVVNDEVLEKLRRLCQLWNIKLKPQNITSHRKFIGPFIVAFKKVFFAVLSVLLKDVIREQRTFNANVIALLATAVNEKKEQKKN